jgi:predicted RNA polymerase sigma factor
MVGDVGLAEDLAQDALEAAPAPVAQRRCPTQAGRVAYVDGQAPRDRPTAPANQSPAQDSTAGQYALVEEELTATDMDAAADDFIGDDLLRLMFICCHPLLSGDARTALTLRLLGCLTTDEIARAYLVPEPTIASASRGPRRRCRRLTCPSRCRRGPSSSSVLGSVLSVIYLVFNEGYTATAGERWVRPDAAR